GQGHFLGRIPLTEQVVIATSLAKAFGGGGGVVICADPALAERIRMVGGPYCFSGPLRPGDLGAACASAKLHLSPRFAERQRTLAELVSHANARCREWGVPIIVDNEVPFFFVALGRTEAVHLMAERVAQAGYHVSVAGFPAVPARCGGVRIAVSALHTKRQLDGVFGTVAEELAGVLARVGGSVEELRDAFASARPALDHGGAADPDWSEVGARVHQARPASSIHVEVKASIADVDRDDWDRHLLPHGCISAAAMEMLERVYPADADAPEHAWDIRYALVRDASDRLLAAAPITTSLVKDDFVMAPHVSAALEAKRTADPYLFTSRVVSTGTMLSEGRHMFLRDGPERGAALTALVDTVFALGKEQDASMVMIRDVPDCDRDVRETLMDVGLVPLPMPDVFQLDPGENEASWLETLPHRRYRRVVRKNIEATNLYRTRIVSGEQLSPDEIAWARQLYLNIARKNLELNVFEVPSAVFEGFANSAAWEWVFIHLAPEYGGPACGRPVAVGVCHHPGACYRALVAGIDHQYLWPHPDREISTYRQLLLAVTRRARELGKSALHLGMGAPREKRRFGAQRQGVSVFVRSDDTFQATRLQEFVQGLGHGGGAANGARRLQ
ncbi:MAG: aminotransferase class I/II-fold pyridoxal phosphate-dependent enzyme, partial [Myxococcota bacterium]